jgi:hypothetical protein
LVAATQLGASPGESEGEESMNAKPVTDLVEYSNRRVMERVLRRAAIGLDTCLSPRFVGEWPDSREDRRERKRVNRRKRAARIRRGHR